MMKKGTKVSWALKDNAGTGTGTVISDEVDGHVQVAVDTQTGGGTTVTYEMHYVIWCTVTWLTVIGI
jgi:hypothetical protein